MHSDAYTKEYLMLTTIVALLFIYATIATHLTHRPSKLTQTTDNIEENDGLLLINSLYKANNDNHHLHIKTKTHGHHSRCS